MTSPNRETEAQQVETRVEQVTVHTKVKASLKIKTGQIRLNLVLVKIITDQEQVAETATAVSKQDLQETVKAATKPDLLEMVTAITSDQDHQETVMLKISKPDLQEMATAVSDQDQAETAILKILNQDLQEMEKDQEQAEMAATAVSSQEALEVLADLQISNRAHLKKAVLKKCQEMKAAVM